MPTSPSPFDRIQKRQRSSRAWVVWVVLAVVLVLATIFFREQLSSLFWRAAAPAARVRNSLDVSEVASLRADLATVQATLADRDTLYKENLDLKARLGRSDTELRVLAGVLQRPPWSAYDTLLVDAGTVQGVAVGDFVSAGGNALIGEVSEVYAGQARVRLFSAPDATYQAMLNGTVPVAVEGQGGSSLRAEVPAGTKVAVGDSVVFPGLMGGIIAQVSAVDAQAGASFIVLYMQLPANPQDLRFVEVLKQ